MIIIPPQFHSQLGALDKADQKLQNNLLVQQKQQKGRGRGRAIHKNKIFNDDFDYNKHLKERSSYLSQLFKETIQIMDSREKLKYPLPKVNLPPSHHIISKIPSTALPSSHPIIPLSLPAPPSQSKPLPFDPLYNKKRNNSYTKSVKEIQDKEKLVHVIDEEIKHYQKQMLADSGIIVPQDMNVVDFIRQEMAKKGKYHEIKAASIGLLLFVIIIYIFYLFVLNFHVFVKRIEFLNKSTEHFVLKKPAKIKMVQMSTDMYIVHTIYKFFVHMAIPTLARWGYNLTIGTGKTFYSLIYFIIFKIILQIPWIAVQSMATTKNIWTHLTSVSSYNLSLIKSVLSPFGYIIIKLYTLIKDFIYLIHISILS